MNVPLLMVQITHQEFADVILLLLVARQISQRAESLAEGLSRTAAEHDTRGTYPLENVGLLKEAGYFIAPIPAQFGGQGIDSVYDVLVVAANVAGLHK